MNLVLIVLDILNMNALTAHLIISNLVCFAHNNAQSITLLTLLSKNARYVIELVGHAVCASITVQSVPKASIA